MSDQVKDINTVVYNVGVTFKVNEVEYDVSNVAIRLGLNTVPAVVLGIGGKTDKDKDTQVKVGTVKDMIDLSNDIGQYQYQPVADLKIDVDVQDKDTDPGGKYKSYVDLKGWYVMGAGINDLGSEGSVSIQVVIVHPIARLHFNNLTSFGEVTAQQVYARGSAAATGSPTNVVEAYCTALGLWNKSQMELVKPDAAGHTNKLLKGMAEDIKFIPQVLGWGGVGMPGGLKGRGKQTIRTILSLLRTTPAVSVWNYLINTILPGSGLMIVPEFMEDKLEVRKASVWYQPVKSIETSDMVRMTMGSTDPSPIAGVICTISKILPGGVQNLSGDQEAAVKGSQVEENVKLVDSSSTKGTLPGTVENLVIPWWMRALTIDTISQTNSQGFDPGTPGTQSNHVSAVKRYNSIADAVRSESDRLVKGHLYSRIGQYAGATILTPLMIGSKGKSFCGGGRVKIKGTETSFFVTNVEHVLDVSRNVAYTQLTGNHVSTLITDNTYTTGEHPYYT